MKNFIGHRERKDGEDYSLLPKNSESNKKRHINTYVQSDIINAKGATGTQRKEKPKIQKQEDLHGGGVTDCDSGDSVGLSRQRAQEQGDISHVYSHTCATGQGAPEKL